MAIAVKCARRFHVSTVELAAWIVMTDTNVCALKDTPDCTVKLIDVEIIVKIMEGAP